MSNTPEPKEVELICGCCDRRDKVNPKTAREWPECCGKQMDRYEDDGRNPGWSWNDACSMLKYEDTYAALLRSQKIETFEDKMTRIHWLITCRAITINELRREFDCPTIQGGDEIFDPSEKDW